VILKVPGEDIILLDHPTRKLQHVYRLLFFASYSLTSCGITFPGHQIKMGGSDNQAPTRKWYEWYSPDQSPEERRLVLKLDLLIVPYAFILYWVKYIDQTNISASPQLNFS
jgi:hypothetical protein